MARKGSTVANVLARKLRAEGVCYPRGSEMFGRRQGVYVTNSGDDAARVRVDFDGERETAEMLDMIADAVTAWGYTVTGRSELGLTVRRP